MIEPAITYSTDTQIILNVVLALITFGIALDLKLSDFIDITREPKSVFVALVAQFVFLPALTLLLVSLLEVSGPLALGMFLVGCCPGGGMSNFFTQQANGNVALSVAVTAFSSSLAAILLPVNFIFWSGLYGESANILKAIEIDRVEFLLTIIMILAIPLIIGLWMRAKHERFALKLLKPIRVFSMVVLATFIVLGIVGNARLFEEYLSMVFWLVLLHNATALGLGFFSARAVGLPIGDQKAISLEVGIQNSALGLAIIFSFFDGNGYMAMIAAWWGVWHLIAGYSLSQVFRRCYRTDIALQE